MPPLCKHNIGIARQSWAGTPQLWQVQLEISPHASKCKNNNCISICMIREWRDCDSNKTNSSKTYINHDPNYCWRRDRCPPPPPKNNGIVTCSSSLIGVCDNPKFKDYDENASNGCETNVQNDDNNWGYAFVNLNCTVTRGMLDGWATDIAVIELFGWYLQNGCETLFKMVENCNSCRGASVRSSYFMGRSARLFLE